MRLRVQDLACWWNGINGKANDNFRAQIGNFLRERQRIILSSSRHGEMTQSFVKVVKIMHSHHMELYMKTRGSRGWHV